MATSEKFFVSAGMEPLTLTVEQTVQATGESRSKIYELIGTGEYEGWQPWTPPNPNGDAHDPIEQIAQGFAQGASRPSSKSH
jgi:hypothetical protein